MSVLSLVARRLTLSQLFPNRNLRNVIEEWVEANGMPEHSAPPPSYSVQDPEVTAAAAAATRAAAAAEAAAAAVIEPFRGGGAEVTDQATTTADHAVLRAVSERQEGPVHSPIHARTYKQTHLICFQSSRGFTWSKSVPLSHRDGNREVRDDTDES